MQGSTNFLSDGHISYYTTLRGLDILRNVIVSEYATFNQINKFFVNISVFHFWQTGFASRMKWLRRPEIARGP